MFLIIGGDSEIGAAIARAMQAQGLPAAATTRRPERAAPERPFLDLATTLESWEPSPTWRSTCICAGVARLAACAADPAGSARINVTQTCILIDKLLARGVHVLFLSTNQVFDGSLPQMPADAPPAPISEYGRQKAETEVALRAHLDRGAPVAILRLAKVVSPEMPLFHNWAEALEAGKPIRAFGDMTLAPVPIDLASAAIIALMSDRARGVFQLAGPRDATYAEVARFIAKRLGADPGLVQESNLRDAGLPEGAGPRHTTLDSSLLRERYGLRVPDVWNVVERVIPAMRATGAGSNLRLPRNPSMMLPRSFVILKRALSRSSGASLPVIHVGFAHSGTTSLQENIFSKHPDIFYAGIPYGDIGGIFSWVKYQEAEHYDHAETARLCKKLIFDKMQGGQRLVISDETLVEQPEVYYSPSMMPVRVIAKRLRALFGRSIVLFTLRNQLQYVISNYLVLKKNYANLTARTIEPFNAWFSGNQTQVRNLFLRNLDPSHAIRTYQEVFGLKAVQVLPLELLLQEGTKAYLDRLALITGLKLNPTDFQNYIARNTSPPTDIVLNDEQRRIIYQRSSAGNAFVVRQFGLPLRDFGYPLPS